MSPCRYTVASLRRAPSRALRRPAHLGLASLLTALLIAVQLVAPLSVPAQPALAPFSGSLLFRRSGDLWQVNLTTGEERLFLRPERGLVGQAVYSPDGQRLAYAVNVLDDAYRLISSDIVLTDAE